MSNEKIELMAEIRADGDVVADEDNNNQLLGNIPVLLPPEMIDYIGKMLDYVSLKKLRQAIKSWSAAVTPEFQRRTVISLSLMQTLPYLKRLVRQTANLNGITSVKINMRIPRPYLSVNKTLDDKILIVNNRLQSLASVLKTLELRGDFRGISVVFPFPPIRFQALTKLVVFNDGIEGSLASRLFTSIYASAPNLSELVVEELNSAVLSPLLNKSEGSTSRNLALAPNLSSLVVVHPEWTDPIPLQTLVDVPQNWTSLDLKIVAGWFQHFPTTYLERLLEKNKDSLVNLKLTLYTPHLNLPESFSKLQKLELEFGNGLRLGSSLIYSRTFPALKLFSLKLIPLLIEGPFEAFWNKFFPPQVFNELKTLKLVLGDYRDGHRQLDNLNWASQMFPNAEILVT